MTDSKDENKEKLEECSCDDKKEEAKTETPKVEAPKVETPKAESNEAPAWFKSYSEQIQTNYTNLKGELEKLKTLEVQSGVRTAPKPTATISDGSGSEPFSLKKAIEKVQKWANGDRDSSCTITIPTEFLRNVNTQKVKGPSGQVMEVYRNGYNQDRKITEALGYTGTQAIWDLDPEPAMEPGGFSFVPVTQFAKYKEIARGTDRASFFKYDLPAPGSQTPGTVATVATMDIESIQVTPSTITGVFLEVDTDDIENNPYDTVGTVVKASAARFDDFIATDMLDTVSAEGTLTPLGFIRADTGATITHTDTASIAFDPTGIATGVEKLRDRGFNNVQPVCFLDPEQFKELSEDSELQNWIAFSNPNVYTKGVMPELYGCKLVVTNAIEHKDNTTTDAHNAIMCIPNHSYGVASARNVTLKFHEVPEENQIWVTTNWRIKSGVIDANSIVRISSVNN